MAKRRRGEAIAELARRQHGVVTRAQLGALGLGRGAIDLAVARRRIHIVHPSIFAVGHTSLPVAGRLMAAVLAGGACAALSHRAAAAHWGIRPSSARDTEVTTPRRRRSRPGLRFYRSALPGDEVTTRDGIPVTTVPRTLFDLAAVVDLPQLRRAVDAAEARRLWDGLSLADLLDRHPRRPGAAAVRAMVASPEAGITRSMLEERFLGFLEASGLPRPATNAPLHLGHRFVEADCAWREQRLIVELDGFATHGTRASFEDDRGRDRALTAAGWRVMRVTWRQLHQEAEALVADLRAALALGPAAESPRQYTGNA
jgi:hypothetical protein